jgi:hypothetical protein
MSKCGPTRPRLRKTNLIVHPELSALITSTVDDDEPTTSVLERGYEIRTEDTMLDEVTPCFQARRAAGEWFFKPMTSTKSSYSESLASYNRSSTWNDGKKSNIYDYADLSVGRHKVLSTYLPSITLSQDDVEKERMIYAVNQAWANLYSSTATLLVDLGEARETYHMFRHPLQGAYRYLTNTLRPRSKPNAKQRRRARDFLEETQFSRTKTKARALADVASSTYLEYTFGWLPFLKSCEQLAEALQELTTRRIITGRGTSAFGTSDSSEFTRYAYLSWLDPGLGQAYHYHRSGARSVTYRAGVSAKASLTLPQSLGLDMSDIPSAVYDLIPLSFILDRFIGVGDWIRANIPRPGLEVLGSWCTVLTSETIVETFVADSYSASGGSGSTKWSCSATPSSSTCSRSESKKVRHIGVTPSVLPPVVYGLDSIDLNHLAEYVALAYQRFGSKQLMARTWRR